MITDVQRRILLTCCLSAPPICPTKVHHQFVLLQTFLEKTNGAISFSYKNYLLGMMFIFEKNIQNTDFWLEMLLCRTYY